MYPQLLPLRRILSASLPLCLLWAFIACVSFCLYHDEDSHDSAVVEALDSQCGEDNCPVTDDPELAQPQRQLNVPPAGEGQQACPHSPTAQPPVFASAQPCYLDETSPPQSGPPTEGHAVLRI